MKKTVLTLCFALLGISHLFSQSLDELYENALRDAAYPEAKEISTNLTIVDKKTPNLIWKTIENEEYVLVGTWVKDKSFFEKSTTYETGSRVVWVTLAPQLQQFAKEFVAKNGKEKITLRLEQLLGLPPNNGKLFFVEMWVRPQDMLRPSWDSEITDNTSQLCQPATIDAAYAEWFYKLRADSYANCQLYYKFPWTQLGYSYDWNPENKNHQGLSEFIIWKNKKAIVHKIYTNDEYWK